MSPSVAFGLSCLDSLLWCTLCFTATRRRAVLTFRSDHPGSSTQSALTVPESLGGLFLSAMFRNCNFLVLPGAAAKLGCPDCSQEGCAAIPVPLLKDRRVLPAGKAQQFAQKHQFSAHFSFLFFPPTVAHRTYFQPFGQKTALTGLNTRW